MKTLTPIALIVAALGLFYMYINPQYEEIKALRTKSDAYDTAIVSAKEVVAKRNLLVAKRDALDPNDIDKLKKLLPDSIDNIRLIIDVNRIAQNHGATLKDIHVVGDSNQKAAVNDAKPYGAIAVSFSTDMSYDEFLRMMSDYEKSLRIFDLSQLSIKPGESGYAFSVNFKTYWLRN